MSLRSLSVQSKLLLAFTLLTLLGIALVSATAYATARASLLTSIERQLVGLQRSKAGIVKTMLAATRNEVLTLSGSDDVSAMSRQLMEEYRKLADVKVTPEMKAAVREFYAREFEPALAARTRLAPQPGAFLPTTERGWYLHYHYIVNGGRPYGERRPLASSTDTSGYATALRAAQQRLGPAIERLGLQNVVLVDPVSLEVFFSEEQSTIFGTRLDDGPYSGSGVAALSRALRNSQDEDDYKLADFEAFRPALGAAKAFVASPVFDGPTRLAVMVVRFPIEPIADALSNRRGWELEGLGKTGEVYLVGPDQTMRVESRFLVEDKAAFLEALGTSRLTERSVEEVRRLGTTILTVPVKHEGVREGFNGHSGFARVEDYRGEPVFSAYGPVDLDSLRWVVVAEMDTSEALAPLRALGTRILGLGAGLALLASVLALGLASIMTRPIAALVEAAREVSAGNLETRVRVNAHDEFRALGEAFNDMVANLAASRAALDTQVQANERLLLSLLPASGAAQVRGGHDGPQSFADVTVAYAQLTGFEQLSRRLGEDQSMSLLSDVVAAFDEAAEHHGVEKVRTIGSSYLAASGLSVDRADHTARVVDFAREVVRIVRRFNAERGTSLSIEIAINAGPVVGGLVGRRKFIYDLWGDTVRLAREIDQQGAGAIVVTRTVYDRVRDAVPFGAPRTHEFSGVGPIELFPVAESAA
ncbi:adenylate/guanylate cyclase domain-containing protein [Luteitalea sp. TBR-22]|uniref:adenylate/guanylate cyclase domain-containing protein n=1 Tax=Luteitalea sp. TBR-22 TaxID=2802971 RepID=UPI001AF626D0|nr:adenylate/guanylate cyclase domain-containing protein [Luteitalea sp. TBR-22]BCS35120.1 adenylate/guanylate cyclase domain-containing protein [Luteitalea sp. TBR-22]